nr:transposase [Thioalkalivibrio denitrificans]
MTYTTNAIESLHSVTRKATKNRRVFPSDASAKKVLFLAVQSVSKRWTGPSRTGRPPCIDSKSNMAGESAMLRDRRLSKTNYTLARRSHPYPLALFPNEHQAESLLDI